MIKKILKILGPHVKKSSKKTMAKISHVLYRKKRELKLSGNFMALSIKDKKKGFLKLLLMVIILSTGLKTNKQNPATK